MSIRAAVLGSPIAHSKSPLLHRAAFAALGMADSEYSRFEVDAAGLEEFLDAHPDHTGFSLTMPLKDRLISLAGERGWSVEETAALTAAGNTLVRRSGQVEIANTDVEGIVRALSPHTAAEGAGASRATILGAGATAASALVACRELGITHVDFRVRNPERARRVLDLAARIGLTTSVGDLDRIGPSRIVISTLPAEAAPDPVWDDSFTGGGTGVALDVAYVGDSTFLAAAAAHGLQPVPGTAMLVEQAVAQFEMFLAAQGEAETEAPEPHLRESIAQAMYAALRDSRPAGD